jgi:4-coumarate--CoA ligase
MKVRGFQVAPAELEGHLLMHPDVVDACVVSIPDEYSGELPLAYVVLSEMARKRISGNRDASLKLKTTLVKVIFLPRCISRGLIENYTARG